MPRKKWTILRVRDSFGAASGLERVGGFVAGKEHPVSAVDLINRHNGLFAWRLFSDWDEAAIAYGV